MKLKQKRMSKHSSCNCKCILNSTTCNSNQKWNIKTCQCEFKNYLTCKKIIVGILEHVFVKIASM